jgi:hypothetical protein
MERRQALLLAQHIVAGIAQHQRVAVLLAGRLDPVQHRHRIGIEDIGHHHSDQPRAPPFQAARHLAGLIAQARDGRTDLFEQRLGQRVEFAAEVARNAGLGYARLACHLRDRDATGSRFDGSVLFGCLSQLTCLNGEFASQKTTNPDQIKAAIFL